MSTRNKFIVIGAGLSRSGTHSTKTALEIILHGKCHHMQMAVPYHQKEWKRIVNNDMTDEEFKDFFLSNGYVATVDVPANLFYQRLMKVFPDAKVLLNVRDPESWERSINKTILPYVVRSFQFPDDIFEMLGLFKSYLFNVKKFVAFLFRHDRFRVMIESLNAGNGVEYYNNWVEDVKQNVPKEKLLVYNVKEGWGPLCSFLEVPVPNQPFPHTNDFQSFQSRYAVNHRRAMLLLYEVITIPIAFCIFYKVSCE